MTELGVNNGRVLVEMCQSDDGTSEGSEPFWSSDSPCCPVWLCSFSEFSFLRGSARSCQRTGTERGAELGKEVPSTRTSMVCCRNYQGQSHQEKAGINVTHLIWFIIKA